MLHSLAKEAIYWVDCHRIGPRHSRNLPARWCSGFSLLQYLSQRLDLLGPPMHAWPSLAPTPLLTKNPWMPSCHLLHLLFSECRVPGTPIMKHHGMFCSGYGRVSKWVPCRSGAVQVPQESLSRLRNLALHREHSHCQVQAASSYINGPMGAGWSATPRPTKISASQEWLRPRDATAPLTEHAAQQARCRGSRTHCLLWSPQYLWRNLAKPSRKTQKQVPQKGHKKRGKHEAILIAVPLSEPSL